MNQKRLRVLLVDDEESYVKIVALGLSEEEDFDVVTATSGQEAIQLIESNKSGFDVIVLDYRMPGLSGLDVLRWIHDSKIETPSFMLTAAGSEFVAVEAMKLGAYDYCRKEDTDLPHLANLIRATHERHMFRVTTAIEEQRTLEILLDKEATDKAQDAVNSITPALNSAFANISADLEATSDTWYSDLPVEMQRELKLLFQDLKMEFSRIEAAVRALLALYVVLYARHPGATEIDRIRKEFEGKERSEPVNSLL